MHMLKKCSAQFAVVLLMLAVLSGCGFRLRGAADTKLPVKSIFLGLPSNSPLEVAMARSILASGGTEIVTDPKKAEAVLEVIQPEKRDRVVLSLNGQGQVVEYTLYYRFTFRVRDNQDRELIPATALTLKRDLSFNAALALAKEAEADALYRDMQADLAQQVLRRLASMKPKE